MSARRVVAGVDSSTQSCKVVVCDADTGHVLAEASAPHPDGTEVDPEHWWAALNRATDGGLLDGVDAVAVGGQQHGLVALDDQGAVVRDSLLWNDLRSAPDTADLIAELGARAWAEGTGSVPAASFTVTKLRWLRRCEPANADRTASVMLPHDWLSWRLAGSPAGEWATDRGDASGTGYFSPATGEYRLDLLERALGHRPALPRVAGPSEIIGSTSGGTPLAAGTGDNMAAALGLGVGVGDVVVSLGTSGVVSAVTDVPVADPSGVVAGFADAAGGFLPLVCTLNAARVLVSTAALLGVDLDELSRLALTAEAGAGGVTMLPYLEGERTPPLPDATGSLFGLTGASMNPANIARAAVEGMLCGLAEGLGTLESLGVKARRIVLIGGAARSEAVRAIAPGVFGLPVSVPAPAEYVAVGAARQAAWALSGESAAPSWPVGSSVELAPADVDVERGSVLRARHVEVRASVHG